jgi:hypothetical protein
MMKRFSFDDGFTRPQGEDLDEPLAQILGFEEPKHRPHFADDDEIPAEVKATALEIGALFGADAVTVLRIPRHHSGHRRGGHPGRHHPAFAG